MRPLNIPSDMARITITNTSASTRLEKASTKPGQ